MGHEDVRILHGDLRAEHFPEAEAEGSFPPAAEKAVIIPPAVPQPPAVRGGGQAGNQDQIQLRPRSGFPDFRRLGDAHESGPQRLRIPEADRQHFPADAFGHEDLLSVREGPAEQEAGGRFRGRAEIQKNGVRLPVEGGAQHGRRDPFPG